ncbi:hypothetical protein P692DRAFT_20879936 [Suillus brevipes Sb2]|nr:hypothetical protein P692DRAFT_20879936 [Suillus brevipes Sb2]
MAWGDFGRVLQHAKREPTIMTKSVSPSFASPGSNITGYIDQPSESSDSLLGSSTPASDELPDGTEFPSEAVGSCDASTSSSPSLPPQGHSNRQVSSSVRTSPAVELPDVLQVSLETINSCDAAPSLSSSFPPHGSSYP